MENICSFIGEKLRLGNKYYNNKTRLIDVENNDELYGLIKTTRGNRRIIKGYCIKTDRTDKLIFQSNVPISKSSVYCPKWRFIKDINYDDNMVVAGLAYQPFRFIFISTNKEYFKELDDEELWNNLTERVSDISIDSNQRLKRFLNNNLQINII